LFRPLNKRLGGLMGLAAFLSGGNSIVNFLA
jgi:hypothetical protein